MLVVGAQVCCPCLVWYFEACPPLLFWLFLLFVVLFSLAFFFFVLFMYLWLFRGKHCITLFWSLKIYFACFIFSWACKIDWVQCAHTHTHIHRCSYRALIQFVQYIFPLPLSLSPHTLHGETDLASVVDCSI